MKSIGTKKIETKRLILRKIHTDDAKQVYDNWTSDPLVARYVNWSTHTSIEDTKEYLKFKSDRYKGNEFCFDWLVTLKDTGEAIGEIEACKVSQLHSLVEMGYCFGRKYWNQGYASEALAAFIDYMFNEVEADIVTACHLSTNPASGKAMEKAGMKFDASLKNYFIDKNTGLRADMVCYSILKSSVE